MFPSAMTRDAVVREIIGIIDEMSHEIEIGEIDPKMVLAELRREVEKRWPEALGITPTLDLEDQITLCKMPGAKYKGC